MRHRGRWRARTRFDPPFRVLTTEPRCHLHCHAGETRRRSTRSALAKHDQQHTGAFPPHTHAHSRATPPAHARHPKRAPKTQTRSSCQITMIAEQKCAVHTTLPHVRTDTHAHQRTSPSTATRRRTPRDVPECHHTRSASAHTHAAHDTNKAANRHAQTTQAWQNKPRTTARTDTCHKYLYTTARDTRARTRKNTALPCRPAAKRTPNMPATLTPNLRHLPSSVGRPDLDPCER